MVSSLDVLKWDPPSLRVVPTLPCTNRVLDQIPMLMTGDSRFRCRKKNCYKLFPVFLVWRIYFCFECGFQQGQVWWSVIHRMNDGRKILGYWPVSTKGTDPVSGYYHVASKLKQKDTWQHPSRGVTPLGTGTFSLDGPMATSVGPSQARFSLSQVHCPFSFSRRFHIWRHFSDLNTCWHCCNYKFSLWIQPLGLQRL